MVLPASELIVLADADDLAPATAERFVTLAAGAIASHGWFAAALSGGSTPRATYARLAGHDFASRVSWPQTHLFWGDERCVPPDDAESNYRMAREALLDRVPIPAANVHRMRGEDDPDHAAAAYERELRDFFAPRGAVVSLPGGEFPRFDLVMLGLGEDGHTASLFPGGAALNERVRWVVATHVGAASHGNRARPRLRPRFAGSATPRPDRASWRLTLTLPVINAAAQVMFLVSGEAKAEALRRVLRGGAPSRRRSVEQARGRGRRGRAQVLPAQMVKPKDGKLYWLVDAAAAALRCDACR